CSKVAFRYSLYW
nr:immunoglobulin heavy chain junction region [Macaca mulatta]MOY23329.1 immunoglobulin heavy chain junction region [Macaca mulatta]MOY23513.1 immunoglobulin heavy chain junction region [Macaca mulatta]MOY25026.1 immunoglobulin heavy chain junction region [Macaca mulatta]MOY25269.1 immunoglobulin heavy chain junction region [Macaca mulatta]